MLSSLLVDICKRNRVIVFNVVWQFPNQLDDNDTCIGSRIPCPPREPRGGCYP